MDLAKAANAVAAPDLGVVGLQKKRPPTKPILSTSLSGVSESIWKAAPIW
jgi:hypothetical protein